MEVKNWQDELLKVTVLQAVALFLHGEEEQALQALDQALELAQPGGFVRIFVNEGTPMAKLLAEAAAQGIKPDYVATLLAAFDSQAPGKKDHPRSQPLIEPLSERELEVLGLVAQGLSNREISQRLFIALDTVKGHNRRIYGKLQVNRRTEAVARARELGLL
jgi:LuxR family maltose regulon positive regulatory protein